MFKEIKKSYLDLGEITTDHIINDPIFKDLPMEELEYVVGNMKYSEYLCIPGVDSRAKALWLVPYIKGEKEKLSLDKLNYFLNVILQHENSSVSVKDILMRLDIEPIFYWDKTIVLHLADLCKDDIKEANITILKEKAPKKQKSTSGTVYISRIKAASVMEEAGGKFFTVVFVKKDTTERTMNCQYLKNQGYPKLGYIKVKEMSKIRKGESAIRNINMQTLISITMGKTTYIIK
jgi:hypothetical protein